MTVPKNASVLWNDFVEEVGGVDESRFYEAFCFGDSQELADSLAELVLRGVKRATATSVWSIEASGKQVPKPGDLSVVMNWAGRPQCIIETLAVQIVPFKQVTAEFAATEGEGDGSLSFWRAAHLEFFSRECANADRRFTEDMLVACETFQIVFRPRACAA